MSMFLPPTMQVEESAKHWRAIEDDTAEKSEDKENKMSVFCSSFISHYVSWHRCSCYVSHFCFVVKCCYSQSTINTEDMFAQRFIGGFRFLLELKSERHQVKQSSNINNVKYVGAHKADYIGCKKWWWKITNKVTRKLKAKSVEKN